MNDATYVDFPSSFVSNSSWDNLAKIRSITAPYLLFHGTADLYVDPRYSDELFAAHEGLTHAHQGARRRITTTSPRRWVSTRTGRPSRTSSRRSSPRLTTEVVDEPDYASSASKSARVRPLAASASPAPSAASINARLASCRARMRSSTVAAATSR